METDYRLGSVILLAAGVWQLTPVKGVCLRHCRSPMGFLVQSWRPGRLGAFRMGLEHGSHCLGCCWFLMGLLFFGGIMNLFWIIGLAGFVLLEKTVPMGSWIGRIVGIGVAVWGALMLVTTTLTIAAPSDYRFEAVEVQASGPGTTTVAVRLVHIQDKKPVEGTVILESKTDMGPSGMGEMSGKVTATPSDQPGLYRFLIALTKIGLPRAGRCRSSIPGGGSAFEAFCQVKYFLPRWWQLTFASDFAEFARDFSVRIPADWPSVLLPFVHIFQFVRCCDREREPIESATMLGDCAAAVPAMTAA